MKIVKYIILVLVIVLSLPVWLTLASIKFTFAFMDDGFEAAIDQIWEGY